MNAIDAIRTLPVLETLDDAVERRNVVGVDVGVVAGRMANQKVDRPVDDLAAFLNL